MSQLGRIRRPSDLRSLTSAELEVLAKDIRSYLVDSVSKTGGHRGPNLGVVERHHERFTLADIPGIIEDAHLGKGLGLDFLRHISRTRLLVFVLDAAEEPVRTFESLRHELQEYDPELLERPALIVLNKADLADSGTVAALRTRYPGAIAVSARSGLPVMTISVLSAQGLQELRDAIFELLPPRPQLTKQPDAKTVRVAPVQVKRDMSGQGWVVTGSELEAIVSRFDPSNAEAVAYLQHHFKSLGVYKLLKRAGAQSGDNVQIGGAVFDFFDDTAAVTEELEQDVSERTGSKADEEDGDADTAAENDWVDAEDDG